MRKLFLFLCLIVGLYIGMGLMLSGVTNRQKRVAELDAQNLEQYTVPDTPLFAAVNQNDANAVARLLKAGANPNETDRVLRTPISLAARQGNMVIVHQLLAAGAEVNTQDKTGSTALLYALRGGRNPAVPALLLARGADAGHQDYTGQTPLLLACDTANADLIEALLTKGADVNTTDRYGMTPLMRAARAIQVIHYARNSPLEPGLSRRRSMELLLSHGADVRVRDKQGWTATLYASENEPAECLQLLLQHGADPYQTVAGRTLLRNAAYHGLVGNLQVLLDSDPKATPDTLSDAMMQAILAGQDVAVRFLLDRGADVNYCDQYGMTPLMLAIANDHLSIARALVQSGANPRARDLLGKTALDYAQPGRSVKIRAEVFGGMRMRRF